MMQGWPSAKRSIGNLSGSPVARDVTGNLSGWPNIARRLERLHPINRGLCGWWPIDEMQGTRIRDLSIYGNHGTLTNAADPATATSGWGAGVSQRELSFDGTDDYINVPHSASLAITGPISISFWIVCRNFSNYIVPIGQTHPSGTAYAGSYVINLGVTSGAVEWLRGNGFGQNYINAGSANGVVNVWRHICVTDDRSNGQSYVDAVGSGPTSSSGVTIGDVGAPLIIAKRRDGYNLPGQMSHARIWNRALTATEIKQLYADKWLGSIGG